MTRDDIIKLAQEAYERGQSDLMESCKEAVVYAIEAAVAAEREACAVAGAAAAMAGQDYTGVAAAIRARGETK